MNTLAMLIGYALMLAWGVFAVVFIAFAGRTYWTLHREAREQARKRRELIDGLVAEITAPDALYWTSDRQISWAIHGPTPEEYWGEERAA